MGREIKRVALDFDYPINSMIWKGYHNPYRGLECGVCGGDGQSPDIQRLYNEWYQGNWSYNLTQVDVQALIDGGRLWDFTRRPITEEQREIVKKKITDGGNSWLPFDNGYIPTAQEVNEWSRVGMGHDSIDAWVCIKARAEREGITELHCSCCGGDGVLWPSEEYRRLFEEFKSIEPPAGPGYQLWSTTTEGTPMSPVFSKPECLAVWLVQNEVTSFASKTESYNTWLNFITGPGWVMSAVMANGELKSGVQALNDSVQEEEEG